MIVNLDLVPQAFDNRVGLPRPNWDAIAAWVGANLPESDAEQVWTEIATQWMNELCGALPAGYLVSESDSFLVLSRPHSAPQTLLRWCEYYRYEMLSRLGTVGRDPCIGKYVVLAFDELPTYYNYVADFYPETGAFGGSGGVFLAQDYPHFVLQSSQILGVERTIAHELTHALLSHLPLPRWLDEGVTQFLEDIVLESSAFHVDREIVRRHRAYWNEASIDGFWSGDSFYVPDDGQELSYHLAAVLVRNICSDYPASILEFLQQAHFADAGDAAAREVFDCGIGERVAQFLGCVEWRPRNDYYLVDGEK